MLNESCFPVPDSEIKKFICSTIRSVALLQKAHVLFYSSKEPQLVKRVKDLFHGIGFGNGLMFKEKNNSYTKPLCIPKGCDTWESIGLEFANWEQVSFFKSSFVFTGSKSLCDNLYTTELTLALVFLQIKLRHLTRFPSDPELSSEVPASCPQSSHPEPSIDSLVALKYGELRNLDLLDNTLNDYLRVH